MFVFVSYEPELHPAATYRIKNLKATIQVFSTGSLTVTGISSHKPTHTLTSHHPPPVNSLYTEQLKSTQT